MMYYHLILAGRHICRASDCEAANAHANSGKRQSIQWELGDHCQWLSRSRRDHYCHRVLTILHKMSLRVTYDL